MKISILEPAMYGERVRIDVWLKSWELKEIQSALKLQELVNERIKMKGSLGLPSAVGLYYYLTSLVEQSQTTLKEMVCKMEAVQE